MRGTLAEVIDRLDEVDDTNRFNSLCIFADGGPDAAPEAASLICPCDEAGSLACPQDPTLSYVLTVRQAQECIQVWSEWRGGRRPPQREKFDAVMHYSRNDAWLPTEGGR